MRLVEVVDLAPDVGPAGRFGDGSGLIESVEAGGLNRAVDFACARLFRGPARRA